MTVKLYNYFEEDVIFSGKHSRYIDDLWEQNIISNSFIKTLYELYEIAAVIGLRMKNPKPLDNSEGRRALQVAQMMKQKKVLNNIMKMIILLEETTERTTKEKIEIAFVGATTQDDFIKNVELFNSYVRGGIEILHQELVVRVLDVEDEMTDPRVGNIIALLNNPLIPEI